MKIATVAKMAVVVTAVTVSFWAQPQMAQAEESAMRDGGGVSINFAIVDTAGTPNTAASDDVIVDGEIITGENYDPAAASSDSEWKYIPIRRLAH